MSSALFQINNLHVSIADKQVLKGLSIKMNKGEVHALMGRNGSGKTTLANSLMGHPSYEISQGEILLDGENLVGMSPDERAKKRLFLGFQYPVEVPGLTVANFLRSSIRAVRGEEVPVKEVRALIKKEIASLGISETFMRRSLNEGFSGGEKKRLETLQLRLLQPKVAILDETDSGLDIDALKSVAENIEAMRSKDRALLLITHYQRMLNYIKPDFVHVLMDGKIVKSGGPELAHELEDKGYDWISNQNSGSGAAA